MFRSEFTPSELNEINEEILQQLGSTKYEARTYVDEHGVGNEHLTIHVRIRNKITKRYRTATIAYYIAHLSPRRDIIELAIERSLEIP